MFVIHVIPLSRTAPAEPLSYRSAKKLSPGIIVTVPLRRKLVPAVVVECIPVQEAKAELKNASFSLLKSTGDTHGSLSPAYVAAAHVLAQYHATTFGSVLSALLIPVIGSESVELKINSAKHVPFVPREELEVPLEERLSHYTRLLESANQAGTLLLVVPTEAEARSFSEYFKKYKPVTITGAVPEKRRVMLFEKAQASSTLVIVTPGFVWIPMANLSHIIIERVSAGGYILPKRPYVDVRITLEELASARKVPITLSDFPLPLEYRSNPEAALKNAEHHITVVDVRKKEQDTSAWKAVPSELLSEIKKVHEEGGTVAVLAVRRGYAPVVICRDCGTAVTDEYGRGLSFATEKDQRVFRSADGVTLESAKKLCKVCGSWNLMPLGVGSERVEEELRTAFPNASIIRIDQDTSSSKLRTIVKVAQTEPGTILVGTELMLPWLRIENKIELAVVASADSLLALPFWRARERFVRVGLMLSERSHHTIIATRHPEDAAFKAFTKDSAAFWKEETSLRKILNYPPFGTLIVFHIEGSHSLISQLQPQIIEACAPHTLTTLPDRQLSATKFRSTSVVQLPKDAWPDAELADKISRLSPSIRVQINSETLY